MGSWRLLILPVRNNGRSQQHNSQHCQQDQGKIGCCHGITTFLSIFWPDWRRTLQFSSNVRPACGVSLASCPRSGTAHRGLPACFGRVLYGNVRSPAPDWRFPESAVPVFWARGLQIWRGTWGTVLTISVS